MQIRNYPSVAIVLIAALVYSSALYAADIVKLPRPQSTKDIRFKHKNEVLRTALELTEDEFGPYEIKFDAPVMKRGRALDAMKSGDLINVYFSPPKKLWLENTIVIDIPMRRGILSYRLLLIHRNDQDLFASVETADDLKKLKAGLQHGWSTTQTFQEGGFDYVKAYSYDGLFFMLESHRFNYLPRGAHEIFDELEARSKELKNVIVEPTLALHLPTPTYTYVSPNEPRLARRIRKGMEAMVDNGMMKNIFDKYYLDDIKKAELHDRKIIEIENGYSIPTEHQMRKELWYSLGEGA